MRVQEARPGGWSRRVAAAVAVAGGVAMACAVVPVPASAATTWSAPVTLGTVPGTPVPALVTAGQASGTAVVAWTGNGLVDASVRTPSAGWSRVAVVSPAGQTAASPATVVRPDGSVVLAWQAQRSSDVVIESSVWTASAGWSSPVVVSRTGVAGAVALGVDGTGNVLAVWGQYDPTTLAGSVVSATSPSAGSWTAPATLATPSGSVMKVSVAVNSSGAAVVGWIRKFNDLYGDVVTRPAGGSFGSPVNIAFGPWRPALQQLKSLQVAIDANGRASAAWNATYAYASAQQADGTWAPKTAFPASSYASNPALAVDSTGTAQMLWSVGSAEASSLPPGGSWTTPATAVFPDAKPFYLGIAPNGAQDFAGWYDNGTNEITAAVHTSSGWGAPMQVSAPLPTPPWIAAVSTAPVGTGALIAWISGTGNPGTVQVSIGS